MTINSSFTEVNSINYVNRYFYKFLHPYFFYSQERNKYAR